MDGGEPPDSVVVFEPLASQAMPCLARFPVQGKGPRGIFNYDLSAAMLMNLEEGGAGLPPFPMHPCGNSHYNTNPHPSPYNRTITTHPTYPSTAHPTMVAGLAPAQHARPPRRAHQHSNPDHGGGRTSTARPTMAAGPAPAQHTRPPRRAHQHSTPGHGGGPSTSTSRPTTAAGHTPAQHARPWRWVHQHSTTDHGCGPSTSTARPAMAASPTPAHHARPPQRATHQHNTPDHGGGPSTSRARPTMAAGQAAAQHA